MINKIAVKNENFCRDILKVMKQAKDYKCSECGEQAVAFWPCVDPDIKSYPWCRKCLDKEKNKLLIKIAELNNKPG